MPPATERAEQGDLGLCNSKIGLCLRQCGLGAGPLGIELDQEGCVAQADTYGGPAGGEVRLRQGCTVKRSVLFEYTRVSENTVFEDVVASPQYCVDRHGKTTYQGDETTSLRWGDARA